MKLSKTLMRALARQYAVELLRSQDEPDWLWERIGRDSDSEAHEEFMEEMDRISVRIENSITASGRAALADREDGHG